MKPPKPPVTLPQVPPLSMERGIDFVSPISWGVSDPARFSALMKEVLPLVAHGFHFADNLFTWGRNNSAMEDPSFNVAWRSNIQNKADQAIVWRRYILATSACHCIQLEGDFVECGVNAGTGIKTVMDYLGGTAFPKTFWGYDTFDYHPTGRNMEGQSEGLFDRVTQRFADYPQVRLIKGMLPASFADGMPETVAYLHIDLNNAEGEIACLEKLFDRVVPGGMIILDDYEWGGKFRAQKQAEDLWFQERNYRVIPLPTGQGMLVKR
ncbi:TylF/MycF/NovP-related O-methyltransferase [Hydrogenophaga sp. RWCD_12]|uniref:TylF/MycF/NovP-related O-methyltransferase n=1 Tax=Hydrogenophaga sp. RWCD_12 TaxID=3391190 RepID=UPI0039846667